MTYATPKQEAAAMAGVYRDEDTRNAARAMLAALQMAARMSRPNGSRLSADRREQLHATVSAAIAQAVAAGIKAEG